MQYLGTITHSERDRPELADVAKLVRLAEALRDLIATVGNETSTHGGHE